MTEIKTGRVNFIHAIKTERLIQFRDDFKYENPHKDLFYIDSTYFGNQDCPHVLNEELYETVKSKSRSLGDVLIIFRINNRNKRGLERLVSEIEKIISPKSIIIFLHNTVVGFAENMELKIDLDRIDFEEEKGIVQKMLDSQKISQNNVLFPIYIEGLQEQATADKMGISLRKLKATLIIEKRKLFKV